MPRPPHSQFKARRVYLVGAGPGDPELLTLRTANLLRRADVVLHDALVTRGILDLVAPTAQIIDIGKRCGQKLLTQDDINNLLVHFGSTVETTVRLKGGDPTIFGRAGEEISALRDAAIPYEIVPGITSATACAAAAGISLTDRRLAASITFITAHRGPQTDETDWEGLVSSGATLAIYMPGRDYRQISERLIEAGLQSSTPCVVVSHCGQISQKVLFSNLTQLGAETSLPSPSLLIVGECAAPAAVSHFPSLATGIVPDTHANL